MAVTYDTATKTDRMDATRAKVANGTLEIGTAGMAAVLATFGLDATAGSVTGTVWTLGFDATTVTASAGGTAAAARIKDSGGTVRVSGLTVGVTGSGDGTQDIELNTTTIGAGGNVSLSSGTITHA